MLICSYIADLPTRACGQGIKGRVIWLSGNQMPGPGRTASPEAGIKREIHIYKPATLQEVTRAGKFYAEIRTELVAKITSKEDGSFKIKLPPGEYSVFTKESGGYFANLFDGNGRINVVEVKRGNFTDVTVKVDYEAAY